MPEILTISNHGPLITRTNYWDLPAARAGKILVSLNAGAFRLLIPELLEPALPDMMTAKECLVSRGPWPAQGLPDAFEILFDDRTADPYAIHLTPQSFDRLPGDADIATPWVLSAWTRPRRGKPHKAFERPCWYRRVPSIPWLQPREPE
jgi:hypothetical protein